MNAVIKSVLFCEALSWVLMCVMLWVRQSPGKEQEEVWETHAKTQKDSKQSPTALANWTDA